MGAAGDNPNYSKECTFAMQIVQIPKIRLRIPRRVYA
jgi:hypothetical protein